MQRILLLLTAFVFTYQSNAQTGKEIIRVTDMLKIKSIGAVSLSKDGSKVVFTVTTIEPDGETKWEYKYVTQLWMANTDGDTSPRQLTTKENSTQPELSPDGRKIAFVRVVDGKPQIFILSLDGGEATQLTKYKYGAGGPQMESRWKTNSL